MKTILSTAGALLLGVSSASAQLLVASFSTPGPAGSVITNGATPAAKDNFAAPNGVVDLGVNFSGNVSVAFQTGTPIEIGKVGYRNSTGSSTIETTTNYNITLNFLSSITVNLSPVVFGIDGGSWLNDNEFGVVSGNYGSVTIGGLDYRYDLSGFSPVTLAEGVNLTASPTAYYITFTPVPEPSTYGLIGALGLVGFVALRRSKNKVK